MPSGSTPRSRLDQPQDAEIQNWLARIVAFIEEQRVVRALFVHLSLWDEARPPPAPPAAARAPVELEYLPWVE